MKISNVPLKKLLLVPVKQLKWQLQADNNIDFSNTFQRDQAQPINRGSYEKSRDVIERVKQVTKDIKDELHESHVTDSFIAAVERFFSNY